MMSSKSNGYIFILVVNKSKEVAYREATTFKGTTDSIELLPPFNGNFFRLLVEPGQT